MQICNPHWSALVAALQQHNLPIGADTRNLPAQDLFAEQQRRRGLAMQTSKAIAPVETPYDALLEAALSLYGAGRQSVPGITAECCPCCRFDEHGGHGAQLVAAIVSQQQQQVTAQRQL